MKVAGKWLLLDDVGRDAQRIVPYTDGEPYQWYTEPHETAWEFDTLAEAEAALAEIRAQRS
jgi:hypothetical protein